MEQKKEQGIQLFKSYIQLTGVADLEHRATDIPQLAGKRLGIVNGSSWVTLWSTYFGTNILPGVKLVNVGNEAIQLNFMGAHKRGEECPPHINIEKTCQYARDLCQLYRPDIILLTCSTMNRSLPYVRQAVAEFQVPVIQIDEPMMERAVQEGSYILIVATHGPTVDSTRMLLEETAVRMGRDFAIQYVGATIEDAFHLLGAGDIEGHNQLIFDAIMEAKEKYPIDCVVLAQLSMSLFALEYPNCREQLGIEVLCSGVEGFTRVKEMLMEGG